MKILVISKQSPIVNSEKHEVVHVEVHKGLVFLAMVNPDIIFCYAEYGVGDTDEAILLKDLRSSILPHQKLIRVGFTVGGPDQLLRLPFSREELQDCLK